MAEDGNPLSIFCLRTKKSLSKDLTPHLASLLDDWSRIFHIDEPQPTLSREAGLLALHLLDGVKDSYRDDGESREVTWYYY